MIEKTIYATLEFIDVELLLNCSTVHSTEDAELYFGTFYKGDTGAKIVSIELIGTDAQGGNVYKQTFDDGSTAEFTAPKGTKGDDGNDGRPGPPGPPGTTDYNELQNKPTRLSDFENDEGFITPAYHDASKQDVITDLATIRSGAAAGATAVQPSEISDMETRTHAANAYVSKESGKGLSSNDYTTTEKSKLAGIESGAQKNPTAVSQLENDAQYLKLQEVKPNGNIVLTDGTNSKEYMAATPSGDPMHYAYVAAGAEYNDTGADIVKTAPWGDQVTHKAGFWYLNGLGDLTNEDMLEIVSSNNNACFMYPAGTYAGSKARTLTMFPIIFNNLAGWIGLGQATASWSGIFSFCDNLETVFIDCRTKGGFYGSSFLSPFLYSNKLKYVIGIINAQSFTSLSLPQQSSNIIEVIHIANLKCDAKFNFLSKLRLESIVFLVNNAVNTSAITITLHADAYTRCVADTTVYTYQGQTYTGIIAYAAARQISIVSA